MKKFTSLQTKLVAIFSIPLLSIIGILVVYGIFSSRKTADIILRTMKTSVTETARKQLLANARATGLKIGAEFDITVQELLGHKDVSTIMIYTHVLNKGGKGVISPADILN